MNEHNNDSLDSSSFSVEIDQPNLYYNNALIATPTLPMMLFKKKQIQIPKQVLKNQHIQNQNRDTKQQHVQYNRHSNNTPINHQTTIAHHQNINLKTGQFLINQKQLINNEIQYNIIVSKQKKQQKKVDNIILQEIKSKLDNNIWPSNKTKISLQLDKEKGQKKFISKTIINHKISQFQHQVPIKVISKYSTKQKRQPFIHKQSPQQITVNIYFPYEPYTVQINYMQKLIQALQNGQNALLQSPTGTGKTLCLLSAALGWAEFDYQRMQQSSKSKQQAVRKKIIFLSRTHTQLKQCIQQLSKTCYRPTMATMSSRQQTCIKKQLDQLTGRQKIQQCSKAIKINAILRDQNKLKNLSNIQLQQYKKKQCRFYAPQKMVLDIASNNYRNKIIDTDFLKEEGSKYNFCPYYYPLFVKGIVDIYFMPYNYLLDADLLSRYKDLIQNSVLIFDEAHNVSEVASQGRSYQLTSKLIDNAKLQLKTIIGLTKCSEQLFNYKQFHFEQIKHVAQQLQILNERLKTYFTMKSYDGPHQNNDIQDGVITKVIHVSLFNQTIYQLFIGKDYISSDQKYYFNDENKSQRQAKQIKQLTLKLSLLKQYSIDMLLKFKDSPDAKCYSFQKFTNFICKTLDLVTPSLTKKEWNEIQVNHYRLFIKSDLNSSQNYTIQLNCLSPSITFQQILNYKPQSIVMTSGTLSPLWSWQQQLQIPFQHQIENPHVIKSDQLQLIILERGRTQKFDFSYSYSNNNLKLYEDLVESVIELLSKIPNGVLVIFPSYRVLKEFQRIFNAKKNIYKLNQIKHVFSQQKNVDQQFLKNFKAKAKTQKGAVLLVVCRGKISQGIDFSDDLCRGVIFVGIPYANLKDPWIVQKKSYLDDLCRKYNTNQEKNFINSRQWYDIKTMRAVNQSLGRVIRHIDDYGMIFLLDARYNTPKLKNYLPLWAKNNLKTMANFSDVCRDTEIFFNKNIKNQKNNTIKQSIPTEKTYHKQKHHTNQYPVKVKQTLPTNATINQLNIKAISFDQYQLNPNQTIKQQERRVAQHFEKKIQQIKKKKTINAFQKMMFYDKFKKNTDKTNESGNRMKSQDKNKY